MDMVMIQGAITGLKTAADIAVSIGKLKSGAEINAKAIELQQIILSAQSNALGAQSAQFSLVEKIRELEKEIANMKAWEAEKQRYKLITPWSGSVVYALKESMSNSESPHYICTNCYQNGRKSILNQKDDSQRFTRYYCAVCKADMPTGYRGGVPAAYAPD